MRLTKLPVFFLLLHTVTHTVYEYGFKAPLTGFATGAIAVAIALLGLRIIDGAEACWKQHNRLEAVVLHLAGIPVATAGIFTLLVFASTFLAPSAAYYPVVVGMAFGIIAWTVVYDAIYQKRQGRNNQQSRQPTSEYQLV